MYSVIWLSGARFFVAVVAGVVVAGDSIVVFVVVSNIQETAKNINMHPSLILRDDMLVALSKLKVFPLFMS